MTTSKNGQGKFILAAVCMLMCILLLAVGAPKAHAEGSGVTHLTLGNIRSRLQNG